MNIAIGSAEGLAHLHHHATPYMIRRDIKESNVLLDSDFKSQVFPIGFATNVTTRVKGTLGYLMPKYVMGKIL